MAKNFRRGAGDDAVGPPPDAVGMNSFTTNPSAIHDGTRVYTAQHDSAFHRDRDKHSIHPVRRPMKALRLRSLP